jgi:hypothetical protein
VRYRTFQLFWNIPPPSIGAFQLDSTSIGTFLARFQNPRVSGGIQAAQKPHDSQLCSKRHNARPCRGVVVVVQVSGVLHCNISKQASKQASKPAIKEVSSSLSTWATLSPPGSTRSRYRRWCWFHLSSSAPTSLLAPGWQSHHMICYLASWHELACLRCILRKLGR